LTQILLAELPGCCYAPDCNLFERTA